MTTHRHYTELYLVVAGNVIASVSEDKDGAAAEHQVDDEGDTLGCLSGDAARTLCPR